jgi:pimeloyl-ACP methyl ester carboxylesterase
VRNVPVWTTPDGRALSYDDYGAGPIIVLIHGSPGTSKAWQGVAERLGERFRVIAPNLPGYGETPRPGSDTWGDIPYGAELIEALLAEHGPPRVVAGHSYGGVLALRMAFRDVVRPRALALFEPVAVRVLEAVGDVEAFTSAKSYFGDYMTSVDAGDGEAIRKMVDYWFGPSAFDRLPTPAKTFLHRHAGENVRDVRATFREQYSLESLRRLAMPVLVVRGSRSPTMMAKICEGIASHVTEGSLVTLDDATHAMTATHAQAVAGLIADLAERSGV